MQRQNSLQPARASTSRISVVKSDQGAPSETLESLGIGTQANKFGNDSPNVGALENLLAEITDADIPSAQDSRLIDPSEVSLDSQDDSESSAAQRLTGCKKMRASKCKSAASSAKINDTEQIPGKYLTKFSQL